MHRQQEGSRGYARKNLWSKNNILGEKTARLNQSIIDKQKQTLPLFTDSRTKKPRKIDTHPGTIPMPNLRQISDTRVIEWFSCRVSFTLSYEGPLLGAIWVEHTIVDIIFNLLQVTFINLIEK